MHYIKENNYFKEKLKRTKSWVNTGCPECFTFYKGEFQSGKTKNLIDKRAENKITKNFFKKIEKIITKERKDKDNLGKIKPIFTFKTKNINGGLTRFQRRDIENTNKYFKNKIKRQGSYYDRDKLERDFQMSQYLKGQLCELPVISTSSSNFYISTRNQAGIFSTGGGSGFFSPVRRRFNGLMGTNSSSFFSESRSMNKRKEESPIKKNSKASLTKRNGKENGVFNKSKAEDKEERKNEEKNEEKIVKKKSENNDNSNTNRTNDENYKNNGLIKSNVNNEENKNENNGQNEAIAEVIQGEDNDNKGIIPNEQN